MASSRGRPMQKQSRGEMIQEILRERIENGEWKPGERIEDKKLAEELQVSRISVREALSTLVATGAVVLENWKGYRLCELSQEEIESVLDVRLSLERLATEGAVKHITPEQLEEMETTLALAERFRELGETRQFRTADYDFHEILYRGCGNQWIAPLVKNLRLMIDAMRYMSQEIHFDSSSLASIREHAVILQGLKDKDGARAVQAMHDHLMNHQQRVLHYLDE